MTEHRVEGAVLVVEANGGEREHLGAALDDAGFTVLTCPGPTEPDFTCIGGREGACPLVDEVAAIVLDMSLDSEALMTGTPAEELLGLYLTAGRPVVVLGSRPGLSIDGQLVRLRRHADGDAVVGAVRGLDPDVRSSSTPAL